MNQPDYGIPVRRRIFAVFRLFWVTAVLIFSTVILTASALASNAEVSAFRSVGEGGGFVEFLPVIFHDYNKPTVYGVEMTTVTTGQVLTMVEDMGSTWIRHNALLWSAVEPTIGTYNWNSANVQLTETELIATAQAGMRSVLIVRSTPEWARLYPGSACGPMKSQYFAKFGQFLVQVVNRYSVPPYNLQYLEIWNEPDVDPSLVPGDQIFGCWGNKNDPYYCGGYYGAMLKVFYPMIKNANPGINVMIGGLLLDCDPRNPPAGQTCLPSKFLEGILLAGAKNSFDGVSFHAYDHYNPDLDTFGNPNWKSGRFNGEVNGILQPVLVAKSGFIREVLNTYGATGKILMNTESALLCGGALDPPGGPGCEPEDDSPFEVMKAAYVAQAYAAANTKALRANLWFTVNGWRNSGLINPDKSPRPAYTAFMFSESMLWDAVFTGSVTGYTKVTGYKFLRSDGTEIWVVWSNDGLTRNIALPETPDEIWDMIGGSIAVNGVNVELTVAPVYIVMP